MTESLRLTIAQDLTAIVDMCSRLEEQAEADALRGPVSDSEAMMALGAVGNTEAATHRLEAAESAHLADPDRHEYPAHVEDWTEDEPPLLVLATWEDAIRDERGEPTDLKATVERAADYLRRTIDWMLGVDEYGDVNFLAVDELVRDLKRVRARLENILREGIRDEQGVPCMYDGKRLRRTIDHRGERSRWFCPACNRSWSDDEYAQRVTAANEAAKREEIDGQVWVSEDYAARDVGRSVKTIRTWVNRGFVARACIIAGRRERFVSLEDVRGRDKAAKQRGKAAA